MSATLDNCDRPSPLARELERLEKENELLRAVVAPLLKAVNNPKDTLAWLDVGEALVDWEDYENDA